MPTKFFRITLTHTDPQHLPVIVNYIIKDMDLKSAEIQIDTQTPKPINIPTATPSAGAYIVATGQETVADIGEHTVKITAYDEMTNKSEKQLPSQFLIQIQLPPQVPASSRHRCQHRHQPVGDHQVLRKHRHRHRLPLLYLLDIRTAARAALMKAWMSSVRPF